MRPVLVVAGNEGRPLLNQAETDSVRLWLIALGTVLIFEFLYVEGVVLRGNGTFPVGTPSLLPIKRLYVAGSGAFGIALLVVAWACRKGLLRAKIIFVPACLLLLVGVLVVPTISVFSCQGNSMWKNVGPLITLTASGLSFPITWGCSLVIWRNHFDNARHLAGIFGAILMVARLCHMVFTSLNFEEINVASVVNLSLCTLGLWIGFESARNLSPGDLKFQSAKRIFILGVLYLVLGGIEETVDILEYREQMGTVWMKFELLQALQGNIVILAVVVGLAEVLLTNKR